jgi:mannose-1-phosphate guanylyltransferase
MKALLLAAGFGTRLKPLTDFTPKCLMTIKNQPLLDIWLEKLTNVGVGPFLINTHYLFNQVEEYAKSSKYKDEIQLVYEPELLGTAATIKANYNFLAGSDCFLIHADNYCLTDFNQFINAHNQRPLNCVMTMMSFQTETPETCGILEIDKNGIVIGFHEKVKNPPGNLANGAVYILSSELIEWINLRNITDFSTQVIPFWLGKIANFENKNIHIDIGSVESYNRAQQIRI